MLLTAGLLSRFRCRCTLAAGDLASAAAAHRTQTAAAASNRASPPRAAAMSAYALGPSSEALKLPASFFFSSYPLPPEPKSQERPSLAQEGPGQPRRGLLWEYSDNAGGVCAASLSSELDAAAARANGERTVSSLGSGKWEVGWDWSLLPACLPWLLPFPSFNFGFLDRIALVLLPWFLNYWAVYQCRPVPHWLVGSEVETGRTTVLLKIPLWWKRRCFKEMMIYKVQ